MHDRSVPVWLLSFLPQFKDMNLGADELATLKLTFGVNAYSRPVNGSPAMSS